MKKYTPWFFLLLFSVFILYMNTCYQFSSDDCVYGLQWTGFTDAVPPKIITFYNAWVENYRDGYRPVVHLFVRIFTGCLDKWYFNIANTIMMICLIMAIWRLAKKNLKLDFQSLVLLVSLVFLVLCKGESYLWCAGSVNYLWSGTASLAFCIILQSLEQSNISWFKVAFICPIAILAGWLQEAFVLPICAALIVYSICNYKRFDMKKALILTCYIIGVFLLVRIAGRRASTIAPFSISNLIMTFIKVALAIKAVWILGMVFLFAKNKKEFLLRNQFLLWIIGASVGMIMIIGFNGERSLWAANLFSIVVIVREMVVSGRVARFIFCGLLVMLSICCFLGYRIKAEFIRFTNQYIASTDGFCWQERVACGPFSRFFYQSIYTWEDGGHGKAFANYHGRNISPIVVSKHDYDLLANDKFCIEANRLRTKTLAYTTPLSNMIVVPIAGQSDLPKKVKVEYSMPKGFMARIRHEIAIRKNPPVAHAEMPRIVVRNDRRFAFLSKIPECDVYIKGITLN